MKLIVEIHDISINTYFIVSQDIEKKSEHRK